MNTEKTPLYNCHIRANAHMAIFANTWLPMRYESEREEHLAVRFALGLFDVSHMGEFLIEGPKSALFLQKMLTRDIATQKPGTALYALMLNENAGIIDDLIVYCLANERFMVCVNAANRKKDWLWLKAHAKDYNDLTLSDISQDYAQLALQGPKSLALVHTLSSEKMPEHFHCRKMKLADIDCLVARTGYSGEDGIEIFVENRHAETLWELLLLHGQSLGIKPCGLAARDSLRLEAGLLLHGNDMDESTTPLEAGLMFAIDTNNEVFIGKDLLASQQKIGAQKRLVGFRLLERGIARSGFPVLDNDRRLLGTVSSGSWPPTQAFAVGFAYIEAFQAQKGREILIDIRNRLAKARIVGTRFLKRT